MALRHLAGLVEKPFAVVSEVMNTPNSAGRYRPFYFRNLVDAIQGRTLQDAVASKIVLITGGSSGIGAATARRTGAAGGKVVLVARTPDRTTRNDAKVREMTCGYAKGVDGINTITHVDVGDGVPHSSPSSRRSLTYLAMICGVMCGMPLSGPTFASWTATGNRSVGAVDPLIGFSGV